jgi:hypothetical protein
LAPVFSPAVIKINLKRPEQFIFPITITGFIIINHQPIEMSTSKRILNLFLLMLLYQCSYAQKITSPAVINELKAAESKMFNSITKSNRGEYLKNFVAEDYFSINADGSTQDRAQVAADTAGGKFFSAFTYKYFDKKIKVYGNVGIITGRCQAFMNDVMGVEFLYTAIFVKEKGKWLFTNWQGTISKNSPPPPPMQRN